MAAFDTPEPQLPRLRRFDDIDTLRQDVYDSAKASLGGFQPLSNATHRLEIADVDYDDGDYTPTKKDEKNALLKQGSLHRPLYGTLRLYDQSTNAVLDEQRMPLTRVPHVNSRGLFVRKGVPWSVRNQLRLRPGIYTRRQNNGGVEAMVNLKQGTGRGFRVNLEPESGLLKMQVGQSTMRLYPIMKALGYDDDQLKESWGDKLFEANSKSRSDGKEDLRKAVTKLGRQGLEIPDADLPEALRDILARNEVDESTTEMTMGRRIKNLDPDTLLDVSRKVLAVARGADPGDNRDSQAFQSIHSAEDFIRDRLGRDQAGTLRKLLWQASRTGKLEKAKTGILDKNLSGLFEGSGLALTPEQINPFETHDQLQAITRLGEGGIQSARTVSRDARNVQSSYLGIIDAGRAPESDNVGLDLRVTDYALKGDDNQLYTMVRNVKTGKIDAMSARDLASKTIAFPGELDSNSKRVPVVSGDSVTYAKRDDVDYEIMSPNQMMSRATAMIPFPESIKGQRLLMGARMVAQAMPLKHGEAPLVQTADDEGNSFHKKMGSVLGAVHTDAGGVVLKVTPDSIVVRQDDGTVKTHDLYNNYPQARKTAIHNDPSVKVGDVVEPGQLLAKSNYTDDKGVAASGLNLRTAFMVAEGATIEDAIVLSESAARKLMSEAMYKPELDLDGVHSTEKKDYTAVYGDRFTKDQYASIDDDGVVKEGTEVKPGDPLILAIGEKRKRGVGAVMDTPRSQFSDKAEVWDHNAPGIVTDVVRTRGGIKLTVKSYDTMHVADKLSGRYGNKGVISEIRPDEQMPVDKDGQPTEVIMNALGTISRVNPGALAEALLGKVAQKTGKPYVIKGFSTPQGVAEFALDEAVKHGVISLDEEGNPVDTEALTDPRDGRKIPGVFTGVSYLMKLHHMAESKMSARDSGAYTTDDLPAKGGFGGSKRVATLDAHSLLSAGATEFLRDAKLIRGQRNDDYWRALRAGDTPSEPSESFANNRFKDLLRAAGVNLREKGTRTQLSPMLDKDVDALAQHAVDSSDTIDFEKMSPIDGGLFDMAKTGGMGGNRFTKIELPVKIPHPLFVDPIQKLLGLTRSGLENVLTGKEPLNGKTGPDAIESALAGINVDRDMEAAKLTIRNGKKTQRDAAVKRLNYLAGLKKMDVEPKDLMVSKIPVIPPKYRPIIRGDNMDIIHDLNYLYKDMLEAKRNYADSKDAFGDNGEEYLTLMNTAQAISGVRDPVNPKSVEKNVKGVLRSAIGVGDTPKSAAFQYRVIGSAVDQVGRGTITSDRDLDMDQVSIPKAMAWEVFKPYVIRRLRRQGMSGMDAVKQVRDQTKMATKSLEEEMAERPVVYNRAPALHRFAYTGAYAKLRDDDAIGLPYSVLKGLGGDYDGDNINVHVPSSKEAVDEVKTKLMPSKSLYHPGTFETHFEPVQDYLAGLYLATRPDDKQATRTFKSAEDARAAYARGEISVRTPIRISST